MIKPLTESENFFSRLIQIGSQSQVECRFPQMEDVEEIIAIYPQVALTSCEVASGRVNYGGRLILTLAYADEEGKLCRIQKGVEFSHFADDSLLTPSQNGLCRLSCRKTTTKREGSAFVVTAVVEAQIDVYAQSDRTYVADCEGAFVKKEEQKLISVLTFSGESEEEDYFDADSVVDVLVPTTQLIITACECGDGEITISGEIYLSLLAMRGAEPVGIDRVISFKNKIACDDSTYGNTAQAFGEIKELNVTATVNEERGKCQIGVVCSTAFYGTVYAVKEAEAAVDAFSVNKNLSLNFGEETCRTVTDVKVYSERASGIAATKAKIDYNCQLKAAALPSAEYSFIVESGSVEGSVTAQLIYEQDEQIKSTQINLPFAIVLNGVAESGQYVDVAVAVGGLNVRQRAEGEIEVEAQIKVAATLSCDNSCRYIKEVTEDGDVQLNDSALSVYIPARGDGLWDIAKKLKSAPDNVLACNPNLSYPLTGKERILIYRQSQ